MESGHIRTELVVSIRAYRPKFLGFVVVIVQIAVFWLVTPCSVWIRMIQKDTFLPTSKSNWAVHGKGEETRNLLCGITQSCGRVCFWSHCMWSLLAKHSIIIYSVKIIRHVPLSHRHIIKCSIFSAVLCNYIIYSLSFITFLFESQSTMWLEQCQIPLLQQRSK